MHHVPDSHVVSLEKVELIRNKIADLFLVGDTSLDVPHPGYVRFRGRFLQDPADCYDALRERFEQHGFTPMVREVDGRTAVIGIPTVFEDTPSDWRINLILFIATVLSTLFIGTAYDAVTLQPEELLQIWRGWDFSLSIMLILGAHELGHYFAARYHKVPVTLPYFIPMPITAIGTMGAFIRMKGPVKNKRALFDVGIAGPLAGFVFAVPILIYGLMSSDLGALPPEPFAYEGNSLIYILAKLAIFQQVLPGSGIDVYLNDIAWAGWVGMLVTGMNLLPLGQLDGGHIAYVLFGQRAREFFWPVIAGLVLIMIVTGSFTWALWVLLLFKFGRQHAEPLDDVTPLDQRRRLLAYLAFFILILVFVPAPFRILDPANFQ